MEFKEYIEHNYVKALSVGERVGLSTKVQVTTLEGEKLDLDCHTYEGIYVANDKKKYENMEQILGVHSKLYA